MMDYTIYVKNKTISKKAYTKVLKETWRQLGERFFDKMVPLRFQMQSQNDYSLWQRGHKYNLHKARHGVVIDRVKNGGLRDRTVSRARISSTSNGVRIGTFVNSRVTDPVKNKGRSIWDEMRRVSQHEWQFMAAECELIMSRLIEDELTYGSPTEGYL